MKQTSNELRDLITLVEVKTGKNMEEIAKTIGYSRPHLSNALHGKQPSERIIDKMKLVYGELISGQPQTNVLESILKENLSTTRVCLGVLAEILSKETGRSVTAVVSDLNQAVLQDLKGR